MLFFDTYYRKFGVRTPSQLLSPVMPHLNSLELSQKAIYHYVGNGPLDSGPASDEYLFRHVTKPIPMMHVTKLLEFKGLPRPITTPITQVIRQYHTKNRRYRMQRMLQSGLRDPQAPLVINYAFLARLYRYQRTMYAEYNRWWNINATVWKTMGQISQETDRNQFIEMGLPRLLPGLTDLRIAAEALKDGNMIQEMTEELHLALEEFAEVHGRPGLKFAMESIVDTPEALTTDGHSLAVEAMNQRSLRIFHTPEALVLLELWKWAGPNRAKSLIAQIPENKYDRINLIFVESGRWLVVNLGVLNKWRSATEEELEANPEANTKGIEPIQFQKRLLRLMMTLFQVRTATDPSVTAAVDTPPVEETKDEAVAGLAANDAAADANEPQQVVNTPMVIQQVDPANIDPKTGTTKKDTIVLQVPEAIGPDPADKGPDEPILHDPHLDSQIEKDLAELDRIMQAHLKEEERLQDEALQIVKDVTLEDSVMSIANQLADDGLMSGAEYRRYQELSTRYHSIVSPDGKRTLKDFIDIKPEEVRLTEAAKIVDIPTVTDKTMLQSSLLDFDERYIKEVFQRDVAGMVMNLQKAGVCVTDYQVERVSNVMGSYDAYSVRVTPVEGSSSTLRFRLPVLEDDGTYTANGVKYHMRKQRGDLPIRKTAPDKVALTSYYGKVWVRRSDKKVNDYGNWLRNTLTAKALDEGDPSVTNPHLLDVFDPKFVCPRLYSILAMGFQAFTVKAAIPNHPGTVELNFLFDHEKRQATYGDAWINQFEQNGTVICGMTNEGQLILMDTNDALYLSQPQLNALQEIPNFEALLGLDGARAPVDYAELTVMGRALPLAFVLAYEMGLSTLCRMLKVEPRIVPAGTRVGLQPEEYSLVFQDETWVFNKDNRFATMILAGFNEYHRALRDFSSHQFDKHDVYLNLLETQGASARFIREIDLMYQMFIDPITKELLEGMHEPTDFRNLLLRAARLILVDQHPDELDPAYMRAKGYERMAGAVYAELIRTLRAHNGKAAKSRYPLELNPYAVWTAIQTDPAKGLVKDINPIQNLKEKEALTYTGTGGRSARSLTKGARAYHVNEMGVVSESTVDSGDVGVNTYTSADPLFNSLRGTANRYEVGKTGATSLFSTSALISPAADKDDSKRTTFISIQHGHGIACKGYVTAGLRTGYEQVLAHRTSDMYAYTAKQAGHVISRNQHGIILEYEDGTKKGIALGTRYGNAEGLTIPHEVISSLKEGDDFHKGDVICYNPGFFKQDVLNPGNVIWKVGLLARTVLMESTQTLEDSSSISKRISEDLTTKITKVRTVIVNFDQTIHRLVKVKQDVGSEDILCIIEDALTQTSQLFDEESLDTLKVLSAQAPQAKFKGTVERIEIYYHGDMEDMSASLRSLVQATDTQLSQRLRSAGKPAFTGRVDDAFRVEGNPLALDTAAIQIYLSAEVPAGVGDKGVFANQMKTVFGRVLETDWKTESGQVIDAVFGAKSIADRIVSSPYVIGTTTTLMAEVSKRAAAIYRKG